ncbi:MAG: hypothetical protein ACYC1M_11100 [Armatimonadota bacterium]
MKQILLALSCLFALTLPAWCQDSADNNSPEQNAETVTVSKQAFDALTARVAELEKHLKELLDNGAATVSQQDEVKPSETEAKTEPDNQSGASSGGKALALPDISFILQTKGFTSSDKRDPDRNTTRLTEGELGIQGWVYPNVKADAFISMSPKEDSPAQLEEGYVSYFGLAKGLNFYVGKKYVSFGRTNQLHSHSWPWVNRPQAFHNLVAEENLTGEGMQLSYLLPTQNSLFAQLDLGTWAGGEGGASSSLPDMVVGQGAAFNGVFNTARLWTGYSVTPDDELELGYSYAEGNSEDSSVPTDGRTRLTGLDLNYRHYGDHDTKFTLRGEQFWRQEMHTPNQATASGYYVEGSYWLNKYNSIGSMYTWSQFPQSTDLHESAISLTYTHQFSEQYYLRLQGNHGWRPGSDEYNELWLMWVCGIGPHTHNLE